MPISSPNSVNSFPFPDLPLEVQEAVMEKMHLVDLVSLARICSSANSYFNCHLPKIALDLGWNPKEYLAPRLWVKSIVKRVKALHKKGFIKKPQEGGPNSTFFALAISLAKHPGGNQLHLIDPELNAWPVQCSAERLPGLTSKTAKKLLKKNWKAKKPNPEDFFLAAYHLSSEEIGSILEKDLNKAFIHQDFDYWKQRIRRKGFAPICHYALHRFPHAVTQPLGQALLKVSADPTTSHQIHPFLIGSYIQKCPIGKRNALLVFSELKTGNHELITKGIDRIAKFSERRIHFGAALIGAVAGEQVECVTLILTRRVALDAIEEALENISEHHSCYSVLSDALEKRLGEKEGRVALLERALAKIDPKDDSYEKGMALLEQALLEPEA